MNSFISIPDKAESLALLKKYSTPDHIVRHSQMVWEVGRFLGKNLIEKGHGIDISLLRASCLLHDIGKYPSIVSGSKYHDIVGGEILEKEGYPEVARIIEQHVIIKGDKNRPIAEEHIVFYSDKRVMHDEIVSLENRFVYLKETYGKTPEAIRRLLIMKEETINIELSIFNKLEFGPEEISKLTPTI